MQVLQLTYVIRVKLTVPAECDNQTLGVGLEHLIELFRVTVVQHLRQAVPEIESDIRHLKGQVVEGLVITFSFYGSTSINLLYCSIPIFIRCFIESYMLNAIYYPITASICDQSYHLCIGTVYVFLSVGSTGLLIGSV